MIKRYKQRKKYKRKRSWDEEVIHFAIKIVGSAVFFFIISAGMDVYHLFHH